MTADPASRAAVAGRGLFVALLTALTYAVTGWFALKLSLATGWASPMYPSAGIALAATLVFGAPGALGAALGAYVTNVLHAGAVGQTSPLVVHGVPAVIAAGAALQALLGRWLLLRTNGLPLTMRAPMEILRFAFWSAGVACLVNATLSPLALWSSGAIATSDLPFTWWTWWVGDTLGVLIGAPIALTLIGLPREEWTPRRLTVGLPMLLGMALLVAATSVFHRWERQRLEETFANSANAAVGAVDEQLDESIYALHAIHGMLASHPDPQLVPLRPATDFWLEHSPGLRAIGFSERVPREQVAAFEAAARSAGLAGYRVFDRADSAGLAAQDAYVVAIRAIEPGAGNAAALGVNAMSIGAARDAMLAAARTGADASTKGFRLTQSSNAQEVGVVVYRALYRGVAEPPDSRLAQWRGVVFATIELDRALSASMRHIQGALQWCLIDRSDAATPQRLAGPRNCERSVRAEFMTTRPIAFADRRWDLTLWTDAKALPGGTKSGSWLFSIVGLAATALLGVLLLTVTGRARRIELAVDERTQALSAEVRERRSAEDALRDSEQRLRSILDHVPIGVIFMDTRGRILDTNPSMCRMLGRSAQDFQRLTVAALTHPEENPDHLVAARQLVHGREAIVTRQMRLLRSDGSYLTVRASLSPLRDPAGNVARLVGVVEDITEHLRLAESERARDAAEASSRAKSEFVSRMSHELRTPLNAMLGFAQLLGMDRRPPLAAHQAGWTAQIQHAGWHLLDMINDTLDMSRIESGAVRLNEQPLELAPLIEACVALLGATAERRGIRVRIRLDPSAARVLADETRLKQVLTNLLSNAIKYNRDGGEVDVDSRLIEGSTVELAVRDTGLGMSAAQMSSLFQPYNRLGRENSPIEGTGIGLVISRRLAELMGGTLVARSVETEGSTFTLCLPLARSGDTATPAAVAADRLPPRYQRRLVHYIEDNETNVEVMRGILVQRPQVTLEVSLNGLDGLAAVRTRRPDLILLDMHLPDIAGLELLRHLKNDDAVADIPVIVLSADATPQHIEDALTLGAMNYLTKPVDVAGFMQVLDAALADLTTRWG